MWVAAKLFLGNVAAHMLSMLNFEFISGEEHEHDCRVEQKNEHDDLN